MQEMSKLLLSPPNYFRRSCSLLLRRCMKPKALKSCKQIHALMLTKGVDMDYFSLSSRLIAAYACCGDLESSRLFLDVTPNPNVFAFNWMILSLIQSGFHEEAILYFKLSQKSGNDNRSPNKHSFSGILKACVGLLDVGLGRQVHGLIYKVGFEKDMVMCNGLIDMYGKCGEICDAHHVFDEMPERDVSSWTTMICGYADMGKVREAVALFQRMRLGSVQPNAFTWNVIIAGHARIGDYDGAFRFFSQMGNDGLVPDLATWNAMISGFVQCRRGIEALELFQNMLKHGIKPNQVTVTGLLPVCGMMDSIRWGREIHGLICRTGLEINVFVVTALIDMYYKCGSIRDAWTIFDTSPNKNVASWNAMIGCYGKHGMVDSAITLFERMQDEAIQPNEVTFTSVLYACSHGGLVEKGLEIFRSMGSCSIRPNKEHHSCLIDLLSRSGRLEEAYTIFKQTGMEVGDSAIGAFLNGCKIHGRCDLAEKISEYLKMELKKPADFVTLSNIYASEGEWRGVHDVREAMKDKRVHKKSGFSSS